MISVECTYNRGDFNVEAAKDSYVLKLIILFCFLKNTRRLERKICVLYAVQQFFTEKRDSAILAFLDALLRQRPG